MTISWWLIVTGIIVLGVLLDIFLKSKRNKQKEENPLHSVIYAYVGKKEEQLIRLQPADEHQAHRIKKLLYSASYHESRNVTAFHNILKELVQISKDILLNGGRERMQKIIDRVEYLCGNDIAGFGEFLSIMRQSYLEGDTTN